MQKIERLRTGEKRTEKINEIIDYLNSQAGHAPTPTPKKRWRAEWGKNYWYITDYGSILSSTEAVYHLDDSRFRLGNYYRTEEEAIQAHDRQLAIVKLTDIINEQNGEWVEDWGDKYQHKYYVYYYHEKQEFHYDLNFYSQNSLTLPYMSEDTAEYILKNHEAELKLIFGVK